MEDIKININNKIYQLRKEVEEKTLLLKKLESENFDVNGVWQFSTEGDCEGRTTMQMGAYKGNLFDGIKMYGGRSNYSLTCERVGYYEGSVASSPTKRKVHFRVYDTNMKLQKEEDLIRKLKSNIPDKHSLSESNYYGCIALEWED